MAQRTDVYVDTSAFIAFLDRSDSYHSLFVRLFAKPPGMITSALVIAEGHGWLLRRYDQQRAIQFLSFIDDLTMLTVEPFSSEALARSATFVKKFADQGLTLADAHGLVIMRGCHIRQCWSTDRHLGLTGANLPI